MLLRVNNLFERRLNKWLSEGVVVALISGFVRVRKGRQKPGSVFFSTSGVPAKGPKNREVFVVRLVEI